MAAETTFAQLYAEKLVAPLSVKVRVIPILSGAGASSGEMITNGFKLARDEINANGDLRIERIPSGNENKLSPRHGN